MDNELRSIRPTELRDYIKSLGWTQLAEAVDDGIFVLQSKGDAPRQIIFPTNKSAADYFDAVEIALRKLQEILKIEEHVLAARIRNVRSDVLQLRVHTDQNKTSIPFEAASRLVSGVEKLIKSAATTVINPQRFHPRLGYSDSNKLLQEAQFDQTEAGSFVMNVSCPVNALSDQSGLQFGEDDGTFVRRVYSTVYRSSQQLINSIQSDTVAALVEKTKTDEAPLISANFCDALAGVLDPDGRTTDLNVIWSAVLTKAATKPLALHSEYAEQIDQISRDLKEERPETAELFVGTVERLDGVIGSDGRRKGEVVLALLSRDEGETIRARVSLNPDDYEKADQAHMSGNAFVQVEGKLLPGRQPRRLVDVAKFGPINT